VVLTVGSELRKRGVVTDGDIYVILMFEVLAEKEVQDNSEFHVPCYSRELHSEYNADMFSIIISL